MKKIIPFITTLLLLGTGAFAQQHQWLDITALNMTASGGSDCNHSLKQFVLIDEEVLQAHMDIYDRLQTFTQEFMQATMNQAVSNASKETDTTIDNLKQIVKEHPELKETLEQQIKALEEARSEYASEGNPDFKGYSMDTAELLKDILSISTGKKAYTGYRDIGRGLYAVTSAPRYGSTGGDPTDIPETSINTWGAIDAGGKSIIDPKYSEIQGCGEECDLIILCTKDKEGNERVGACGYDGRNRIPLDYTNLTPFRFGVIASKDGSESCGVMSFDGKQVIHAKYVVLWDSNEDEFSAPTTSWTFTTPSSSFCGQ